MLLPRGTSAGDVAKIGTAESATSAHLKVHLVDFGLARRWREPQTGEHVLPVRRRGVVGTGRFASLSNHCGEPLGRRDDLEALGFTLAFLRGGRLPWSGLMAPSKAERFALMLESKRNASLEEIGADLPPAFTDYLHAVRELQYDESPKYAVLERLLSSM